MTLPLSFPSLLLLFLFVHCLFVSAELSTLDRLSRAEEMIEQLQREVLALKAQSSSPSLGYINAANSPWNVIGDGVTDNTFGLQAALNNASASGGGVVFLPAGNYYFTGTLVIPGGTTLKGTWQAPPEAWGAGSSVQGTTLLVVSAAAPFLFMSGSNGAIEGISIFYPNQIVSSAPIPFPFTIQGNGFDLAVKNLLLVNSYQGIDFASYQCARHLIEGVYGQPLKIGIQVDQCYDIGRIKTVHFWPFWSQDPAIEAFQGANAITFLFYRSDWEVVEDVFSWGYQYGIYFTQSANGATNGQFTDINFDNVDVGILFQFTQPYGVFFSNLNIANAGNGNRHIGILGDAGGNSYAVIRGASFWGSINQCVDWDSAGFFMIADSLFQPSGGNQPGPAIQISTGRAMIRGNYFEDAIPSGVAVAVGGGADRVMIVDNELVGNALQNSGPDTLIANNHA